MLRSSKAVYKVDGSSTSGEEEIVPKLLTARQTEDTEEERKIRKLAGSRHAPGDWIFRARIISLSWRGLRTTVESQLFYIPKIVLGRASEL